LTLCRFAVAWHLAFAVAGDRHDRAGLGVDASNAVVADIGDVQVTRIV